MGLLEVENLSYYYPDKQEPALEGINLQVFEGEFIFLTGPSGCGKSSLLRAMGGLLPDYYGGHIAGEVRFENTPLRNWNKRRLARSIGIIFQDPEEQAVMTTVEQEVAFGLENLGVPREEMRRRVAEVLAMFELGPLKKESTVRLSGGMKQKTILAAVLAMQPQVLLLDEPTSQLDPVAAQEFLNYVHRLNQEWGLTIIIVEQRVDRCFHLADRVVVMDKGRVAGDYAPREMVSDSNGYASFLPPVSRVFAAVGAPDAPLTVKDGREVVRRMLNNQSSAAAEPDTAAAGPDTGTKDGSSSSEMSSSTTPSSSSPASSSKPDYEQPSAPNSGPSSKPESEPSSTPPSISTPPKGKGRANTTSNTTASTAAASPSSTHEGPTANASRPVLETRNLSYAYTGKDFCLRNINLQLYPGEITAVLGENGAGKSTLLKTLCGLLQPQRGKLYLRGENVTGKSVEQISREVGLLTQNPNDYLFNDTVYRELEFGLKARNISAEGRVEEIMRRLHLEGCEDENPRDLSGGERQRVALGTVMVTNPGVLLLDEPTRGMDARLKTELSEILQKLAEQGISIVIVSHDVEFVASMASKVILLSGGELIAAGRRDEILANSLYFAPQVSKLFRGILDKNVMSQEEAVDIIREIMPGRSVGG